MNQVVRHVCLVLAVGAFAGCVSSGNDGKASDGRNAAAFNLQLGVTYLQQGNLAVAKEKLERAAKQNPDSPAVHSAMGLLYERLGDQKRADEEHRRALARAPGDPEILNNYAVYLCRNGRSAEGVQRFEQAASNPLYRTPWAAYTNAGVCLRAAARDAEAASLARQHEPLAQARLRRGRSGLGVVAAHRRPSAACGAAPGSCFACGESGNSVRRRCASPSATPRSCCASAARQPSSSSSGVAPVTVR